MTKKFRVWSDYHKKFVVQGAEFGLQRLFEDFSVSLMGKWQRNEDYEMPAYIGGYKIQQWTGLTDSQGVEIYEGDIVEYKISGYKYRDLVFYEGCSFKSGPLDKSSSSPLEGISVIGLIVGNIFESPIK